MAVKRVKQRRRTAVRGRATRLKSVPHQARQSARNGAAAVTTLVPTASATTSALTPASIISVNHQVVNQTHQNEESVNEADLIEPSLTPAVWVVTVAWILFTLIVAWFVAQMPTKP